MIIRVMLHADNVLISMLLTIILIVADIIITLSHVVCAVGGMLLTIQPVITVAQEIACGFHIGILLDLVVTLPIMLQIATHAVIM
jgi:hypothetical protein